MRRREFITFLGGAAVVCPLAARAQPSSMPTIGYIRNGTLTPSDDPFTIAFREGLAEMGFTEGRNVAIEYRSTEGHLERLPRLTVDLVRRPVAVMFVAGGDMPALVAKGATRSIPIVFTTTADPVRSGLVDSLNRPGANVTGVTTLAGPLGAKRLELLRELVPKATTVGLLVNPNNTNSEPETADILAGARALGLRTHTVEASNSDEVSRAFAKLTELKAGALLVYGDPIFFLLRSQIVLLAAQSAIPTIYNAREFVHDGGLISYGASFTVAFRQCGNYVGRILKGEKPADIPVLQPTKFELVVNVRTAKALGLDLPPSLLTRADEVIE